MPIIRIDKSTNYTIIQNSILRDARLSLKACGLLCKMLSHCDSWNFTITGLTASTKDGRTVVSNAVKELESLGYLVRKLVRDNFGRIVDTEYWIYESPKEIAETADGKPENGNEELPSTVKESSESNESEPVAEEFAPIKEPVFFESPEEPLSENPKPDTPETGNLELRNTNIRNTNIRNTIYKNPNPSISLSNIVLAENLIPDEMEYEQVKNIIRENINYETVCKQYPQERVDEIIEIAAEVVCMPRKTITVGTSVYPYALAKDRIFKLDSNQICYIIDSIDGITHKIRHIKPYLTKTILEAGTTIQTHYFNGISQESRLANSSFDTDSFFAAAMSRAYGN